MNNISYKLVDQQGAGFCAQVEFGSLKEVFEQFQSWAECDGYEDPTLKGWTIEDCLTWWQFEIVKYHNRKRLPITEEELSTTIIK